jgi:sucrose phosphorylase
MEKALEDPESKLSHIRRHLRQLGLLRVRNRAFHPNGEQKVLMLSPGVFSVFRTSPEGDQHILALTSVSNKACSVEVPLSELGIREQGWYDLVREEKHKVENDKIALTLKPYDIIWLKPSPP